MFYISVLQNTNLRQTVILFNYQGFTLSHHIWINSLVKSYNLKLIIKIINHVKLFGFSYFTTCERCFTCCKLTFTCWNLHFNMWNLQFHMLLNLGALLWWMEEKLCLYAFFLPNWPTYWALCDVLLATDQILSGQSRWGQGGVISWVCCVGVWALDLSRTVEIQ